MQCLHQGTLAHEPLQRRRPAFADRLQPVQVNVREQDPRESRGLCLLGIELRRRDVEVNHLAPIRKRQAIRVDIPPLQHALRPELLHEDADTVLDGHLVVGQDDLRLQGWFIRRVHAGEALDLACRHLLVQALGVAVLHHIQRHVHEHFHELEALVFMALAGNVTVISVRRD